jgi:two-component sensor histidine kinase
MKKTSTIIKWVCLLLFPLSILGQKVNQPKQQTALLKLTALGLQVDTNLHLKQSQATKIMAIWDSLYDIGKKLQVTNALSDTIWEQLIQQELQWAKLQKNKQHIIRLQYYLAHIYHAQKLFSKSIPIQIQLIQSSIYLTKQQIQKTYSKLEKAYVQTNNLNKALSIRKARLRKGLTESSYDLYQDFDLPELALKDFLLFENPKQKKIIDQYKYFKVLGVLYFETGKIDSAKKYFTKGLALSNLQLKQPSNKVPRQIHINTSASFKGFLGRCYMEEGYYKKAIQLLLLDVEQSDEDVNNKIFKMIHLANCYIQLKDASNANRYIKQLDQLTKNKEDKRMAIRFYELKSKYYRQINAFDSAYYYARQYIALKDIQTASVLENQAILLLSNIEADERKKDLIITKANLEIERSEKKAQSILLWASIIVALMTSVSLVVLFIYTIQKTKSRSIIEKKNEENELLLKELHHRVKNNLQVIYSLINLQKRRLETTELNQSLSMVQNRIKTMSLVHQNLHENESLKDVNLAAYIKTIADYLKSLYLTDEKEIMVDLNIDDKIALTMDKSITIGLLVNEIMSNSLKYAFKGKTKGAIAISFQGFHDGYQMKISDNGNGFIANETKSKSLGMYLIKNLVKQLQGKYEVESIDGTTYIIYFKA